MTGVQTCALPDRKSTRLNSSHTIISYAGFCLKKKKAARWLPRDARPSRGGSASAAWWMSHPARLVGARCARVMGTGGSAGLLDRVREERVGVRPGARSWAERLAPGGQ